MVHKRLGCISTSTTLQLQLTTVITSTVILLCLPAALIHHHVAPDRDCHRAVQPARHAYATGFQNSHKYLPQVWYISLLRTYQAMQHTVYEEPIIRTLLLVARRLRLIIGKALRNATECQRKGRNRRESPDKIEVSFLSGIHGHGSRPDAY